MFSFSLLSPLQRPCCYVPSMSHILKCSHIGSIISLSFIYFVSLSLSFSTQYLLLMSHFCLALVPSHFGSFHSLITLSKYPSPTGPSPNLPCTSHCLSPPFSSPILSPHLKRLYSITFSSSLGWESTVLQFSEHFSDYSFYLK